ncbi:hypothetical protein KUTeg_015806 [Tegillarca granosa]|uniref:Uncharacterized protein n=1 Tax=Tegillarca granosa TaxID=220873 RepID=A0ABQ9EMZ5_TEGGR|nr:hypothetical protein KUTeg_015806 [Tegillarca granosa]
MLKGIYQSRKLKFYVFILVNQSQSKTKGNGLARESSNHAGSVNTVDVAMQTSPQLNNDIKSRDNIGSVLNQSAIMFFRSNPTIYELYPCKQTHRLAPPTPPVYGLPHGVSPNMRAEFMDINRQYLIRSSTSTQIMSAPTPQLHQVHQVFNPQPQSFGSRTDTWASPENVPELTSNPAAEQFADNRENRDRIDGNEFNHAELEERSRSMRDNLVFSGIPEQFSTDERGNRFEETEKVLKDILEKEMQIDSVKVRDKGFHRVHRVNDSCVYIPPEGSKYSSAEAFNDIEDELASYSDTNKHSSLHFKLEVNINCPKNNKNTKSQQIVRWNPDKTEEFVNSFDINVVNDLISSLDILCCNSKTNQDTTLEYKINDIVNHLGHLFTQSADCVIGSQSSNGRTKRGNSRSKPWFDKL